MATLSDVGTFKDAAKRVLYPTYEARLVRQLDSLGSDRLPKHVGVMLDGNRRWARSVGADTAHGHRAGAANIEPFLGWCDDLGIEVAGVGPADHREPLRIVDRLDADRAHVAQLDLADPLRIGRQGAARDPDAEGTTAGLATGAAGAPKFGDEAAWAPRIKTGYGVPQLSAILDWIAQLDEVVTDRQGVSADLGDRQRTVRTVAGVTDVDDVLVGQLVDDRPRDREPPDTGVENPDRAQPIARRGGHDVRYGGAVRDLRSSRALRSGLDRT